MLVPNKLLLLIASLLLSFSTVYAVTQTALNEAAIAERLGWVTDPQTRCGGYYVDSAFLYPENLRKTELIEIMGHHGLFSLTGTSSFEGKLTITYQGQQMTADKAYLYRDAKTEKITYVEFLGNVELRDPHTLVVGSRGTFNFQTRAKTLEDLLYRTTVYGNHVGINRLNPALPVLSELQKSHKVVGMTAWGEAQSFTQQQPKIIEVKEGSYSTCPPISSFWRIKAGDIVIDKNSGRGTAKSARLYIKNTPIFYAPYLSFPVDSRRKSGFLMPMPGSTHGSTYLRIPYYWNMAPNYDMLITPDIIFKRGLQISDRYRYLTTKSDGILNFSVLPHDQMFANYQTTFVKYANEPQPVLAESIRLKNASDTRSVISWHDNTRFNDHWSTHVDFNHVSDDYYLQDFGSDVNETTQNQLLQEGSAIYKSEHWNFTGRVQGYQTLHPIEQNNTFQNQYRRLPQLILEGDYPNQPLGLDYFVSSELTNFSIIKNPGSDLSLPTGDRIHMQPGISLPLNWPYFFITPRAQLALTEYDLTHQVNDYPNTIHRVIPIFDVHSGLAFNREATLFSKNYNQTLEPEVYYTFVPNHGQQNIPTFDTTVNTLTYDQLFNFNRFSGLDRIGDANQISVGVTTRLIENTSGLEKLRAGVGEIVYFANRHVTLCNTQNECTDYQGNPNNTRRLSPLSGILSYALNPQWKLTGDAIWNPQSKEVDNGDVMLHYQPEPQKIVNVGYNFVRNGDILSGIVVPGKGANNIKLTDFSFAWPLIRDWSVVGRWSQDWNKDHFQNLLYGLQYDTCCWATRIGGGRSFVGLKADNSRPIYNTQFYIQLALKGFANIGPGNPDVLIANNVTGYNSQFGQDT